MSPEITRQIDTAFDLEFSNSGREIAHESQRANEAAQMAGHNPAFAPAILSKALCPRIDGKAAALTARIRQIFESFGTAPSETESTQLLARYRNVLSKETADSLAAIRRLKSRGVEHLIDFSPQDIERVCVSRAQEFELMLTAIRTASAKRENVTHAPPISEPARISSSPIDFRGRIDRTISKIKSHPIVVLALLLLAVLSAAVGGIENVGKLRKFLGFEPTDSIERSNTGKASLNSTSVPSSTEFAAPTVLRAPTASPVLVTNGVTDAWEAAKKFNDGDETKKLADTDAKLRAALNQLETVYDRIQQKYSSGFQSAATGFSIDPKSSHVEYQLGLVRIGFGLPKSFDKFIVEIRGDVFSFQVAYDGRVAEFYSTPVSSPVYGAEFEESVKRSMASQLATEMTRQN